VDEKASDVLRKWGAQVDRAILERFSWRSSIARFEYRSSFLDEILLARMRFRTRAVRPIKTRSFLKTHVLLLPDKLIIDFIVSSHVPFRVPLRFICNEVGLDGKDITKRLNA